jgi:hypothetical protein
VAVIAPARRGSADSAGIAGKRHRAPVVPVSVRPVIGVVRRSPDDLLSTNEGGEHLQSGKTVARRHHRTSSSVGVATAGLSRVPSRAFHALVSQSVGQSVAMSILRTGWYQHHQSAVTHRVSQLGRGVSTISLDVVFISDQHHATDSVRSLMRQPSQPASAGSSPAAARASVWRRNSSAAGSNRGAPFQPRLISRSAPTSDNGR